MSFFSVELGRIIRLRFEGSQQKFSNATRIDPSMVSRQCSGQSLPDPTTIQKVIPVLSPEDSANLVAAYLRDLCPREVRERIEIQPRTHTKGILCRDEGSHLLDLSSLPPQQWDIARTLVRWMQVDSTVSDFLRQSLTLINRLQGQDASPRKKSSRIS